MLAATKGSSLTNVIKVLSLAFVTSLNKNRFFNICFMIDPITVVCYKSVYIKSLEN